MGWRHCGACEITYSDDRSRCPKCLTEWEAPAPTYAESQLARIHHARLVVYGNSTFIAKENLAIYEDYDDASVGDIVIFQGPGGSPLYFEIAGDIEGWGPQPVPAWLLLRIDPDNSWPKDWKVLDVDPSEAVILGKEKEEGGADNEEA